MTTRGFITAASGPSYVRMAYALALSINSTQTDGSKLSVIVDDEAHVLPHYREAFDQIFSVGEQHHTTSSMTPRSKFYDLSPYDSTICLDADMVLLSDHSVLWDCLEKQEITWADAFTIDDEKITNRAYRLDFDAANLPDVYSAFFFFRKGEIAETFFNVVKSIFKDWPDWRYRFLKAPHCYNRRISTDIAFALAAQVLQIKPIFQPRFIHYKQDLHTDENVPLNLMLTTGSMFVDRYRQYLPFHYYDKSKTEDLIEWLGGL